MNVRLSSGSQQKSPSSSHRSSSEESAVNKRTKPAPSPKPRTSNASSDFTFPSSQNKDISNSVTGTVKPQLCRKPSQDALGNHGNSPTSTPQQVLFPQAQQQDTSKSANSSSASGKTTWLNMTQAHSFEG